MSKPKTRKFDKKNAMAFASELYSVKDGQVKFMMLCDATLSNGKEGKRTLHCAVGEAYFQFVSQDMKKVLSYDKSGKEYISNLSDQDGSTGAAIDALVAKAILKSPTEKNKECLAEAIADCVNANDGASVACERSEDVASMWTERVVPLLK